MPRLFNEIRDARVAELTELFCKLSGAEEVEFRYDSDIEAYTVSYIAHPKFQVIVNSFIAGTINTFNM